MEKLLCTCAVEKIPYDTIKSKIYNLIDEWATEETLITHSFYIPERSEKVEIKIKGKIVIEYFFDKNTIYSSPPPTLCSIRDPQKNVITGTISMFKKYETQSLFQFNTSNDKMYVCVDIKVKLNIQSTSRI